MVRCSRKSTLFPTGSGSGLLHRRGGVGRVRTQALRILPKTNQVGENAVRARNTVGHLAVEGVGIIDVDAPSIFCIDKAALLGSLTWIVSLQQGLVGCIPALQELRAAL